MLKISVLMTVYNAENILDRSINGILNQTYKYLEFVIVNDGSNDQSEEIIKKYAEKDQRIIFVNRKKNKGRNFSLNEGLQLCSGDWIAINDADDISFPYRLEKITMFITENGLPNKFGVVGSACQIRDLTNNINKNTHIVYGNFWGNKVSRFRVFYSMPFIHSSFIYNANALREVGGFAIEVTAGIDYLTLLKIANKYPIYALDEVLVVRYIDGNNFFLKKCMTDQSAKNEKIITTWLKNNYRFFYIFYFLKVITNFLRQPFK